MTKRLLLLSTLLLSLTGPAWADDVAAPAAPAAAPATAEQPASGAPVAQQEPTGGDPAKKTDIVADQMEINSDAHKAVFTGKVVLKRGDVTWNADTMTVDYDEIPQPDGSSKSEVKTVDSKGNIKIVTKTQTITGQWAKMDVKANKLQVGGNVKVINGRSVLTGELMNSDLDAKKTEMSGGRVKGSFLPN